MNLKKKMVTMMQPSACISKLVSPKGLLGKIQILCVELIMPASIQELKVKLSFNFMKHHAVRMYGGMWRFRSS